MNRKLNWIADVNSSKVSVFKLVQTMSSGKPGKYLLGKWKYKIYSYVVGVYFDDTVLSEGRPMQFCVVGYIDP